MKIWRVMREVHAGTAFSGAGSERAPGRWHNLPNRVVYATATPELAILEAVVQVRHVEALAGRVLVGATLPDAHVLRPKSVPAGWDAVPHGATSRAFGDAWLADGKSWALAVPSAISPGENILLNPNDTAHATLVVDRPIALPPALTAPR